MSIFTMPVPMDETPEADATGTPAPQAMNALMALALRQQQERQKRQAEANAALEEQASGQRGQAQALRNLSLMSSFGSNPLLQGLQREAGSQGAQLEGMAARTEARVQPSGRAGELSPGEILRAAMRPGPKPVLSTDPMSPASRAAQARVKAIVPNISDDDLSTVTAASEGDFLKYRSMTESRGQRGAEFAKMMGFRWADLNQDEQLALLRLMDAKEGRAAAAAVKKEEQVAGATERLGKELVGTGAPGFYERYDEAQSLLQKMPSDIPGFGRIEGHLPDEAVSPEARKLRKLVGQMLSEYRKGQTGAGMSDAERLEYGRITGLVNSGTDAGLKEGLEILKSALDARVKSTGASYRPEAVETLSRRAPRLGNVLRGTSDAPKAPATQAMPQDASGSLTLDKPTGGDMVRVVLNGQPQRIPKANLEGLRALVEKRRKEGKQWTLEVPNG